MRTPHSIHSRSFFSLVLALLASATMGCGQGDADDTSAPDESNGAAPASTNPSAHDGSDASTHTSQTLHDICEVTVPAGLDSIAATDRGLVIAVRSSDGSELVVRRSVGLGCALSEIDEAPIAAARLVDADDLGNIYVSPATSTHRGVISSSLPGGFDTLDSTIMKVDRLGNVSRFAYAGRGIWGFGVAPGGDAIWMSSCGPTGIFSVTPSGLDPSIPSPDTLWAQTPSVLTSASTFWSVGTQTCYPPAPMTPSCASALVRTTAEGSTALGTTFIDFGAGYEQGSLARCGSRVCGVFTSAVVIWDEAGRVIRTITMADVSTSKSETIEQVTGNDHGVYLLVRGDHAARVVFMGAEKTAQ